MIGVEDVRPGTRVFVDGEEITHVREVCLISGTIYAYALDDDGSMVIDRGREEMKMRSIPFKKITIELPD